MGVVQGLATSSQLGKKGAIVILSIKIFKKLKDGVLRCIIDHRQSDPSYPQGEMLYFLSH